MNFLIDSALRMSVVLGAALLAMMFLRRRSAAVRHWVLSAAVLCAGLMPVGTLLLPAWSLSPAASQALSVSVLTQTFSGGVSSEATPVATTSRSWPAWPMIVWFSGSIASFLVLAVGCTRLMRAVRRSEPVTGGPWFRIAESVSRQYSLRRRVRLLRSKSSAMLVTWGSLRPRILLPAGSEQWSEERVGVVLQHEMAHVRRNDWLMHTVAELLRIVYWFNPLLWVVCRRLRLESEYAADDAVLAQGVSGSRYAAHLLEIVRTLQQRDSAWSAASAMARPSTIERRFSAMLNSTTDRRPMGRTMMIAVAFALLCTSLSLAAFSSSVPIPAVVPAVGVTTPPVAESPEPAAKQAVRSPVPVPEQQPQAAPAAAPKTHYKGELISLDLKNTDIKDFFRLIGDLSGLNVVLDSDVTGQITVVLKEIPWDQALDIVANNYQLGLELQGKVLRVSSKPRAVPQGRIILDFEVFKNGQLLEKSRAATAEKVTAVLQMLTNPVNPLLAELSSKLVDLKREEARLRVQYPPEWPANRRVRADIETIQRQISEEKDKALRLRVTPTQVAANKIDVDLKASIGEAILGGRFGVSKDNPGKIIWEAAGDSYEITVALAATP